MGGCRVPTLRTLRRRKRLTRKRPERLRLSLPSPAASSCRDSSSLNSHGVALGLGGPVLVRWREVVRCVRDVDVDPLRWMRPCGSVQSERGG